MPLINKQRKKEGCRKRAKEDIKNMAKMQVYVRGSFCYLFGILQKNCCWGANANTITHIVLGVLLGGRKK